MRSHPVTGFQVSSVHSIDVFPPTAATLPVTSARVQVYAPDVTLRADSDEMKVPSTARPPLRAALKLLLRTGWKVLERPRAGGEGISTGIEYVVYPRDVEGRRDANMPDM